MTPAVPALGSLLVRAAGRLAAVPLGPCALPALARGPAGVAAAGAASQPTLAVRKGAAPDPREALVAAAAEGRDGAGFPKPLPLPTKRLAAAAKPFEEVLERLGTLGKAMLGPEIGAVVVSFGAPPVLAVYVAVDRSCLLASVHLRGALVLSLAKAVVAQAQARRIPAGGVKPRSASSGALAPAAA